MFRFMLIKIPDSYMVEVSIIVILGWIKWEVINNLVTKEYQQHHVMELI